MGDGLFNSYKYAGVSLIVIMGRFNDNVINVQGFGERKAAKNYNVFKPKAESNHLMHKNKKQNEEKIQHNLELKERFEEQAKIKQLQKMQEKPEGAPVQEEKII